MATRQEMWDQLGAEVDLLVIGGGINGAGIARDASRRGLSVVLVEMHDLASGTSSRSSKLVHGGLRYLEQLELGLVFESVSERRILLDIAPHIVNPLPFLFPVYKDSARGLTTINAGMWLYEGLSLFRSPKRHRNLDPDDIAREEPTLDRTDLKGAPLYYDCSTDDARLTLENALDAIKRGAVVVTRARASRFEKDSSGRIESVLIEDTLGSETKIVRPKVVVNATGPWTDRVRQMSLTGAGSLLRPTKGVHIVVEHNKLPINHAVVCMHPKDERVMFAIPWGECTYLGTTDTDYDGDPGEVYATAEDVDYLLAAARKYFPSQPLGRDDVISTWAGLRPLMRPADAEGVDESAVSREHQIVVGPDGLVTVAGGKLTTYRRMSAEVVDTAVSFLRLTGQTPRNLRAAETDAHVLPGAVGWPDDDDHERVAERVRKAADPHLSIESARLLANTYGMLGLEIAQRVRSSPDLARPLIEGRPEIVAQIDWAVQEELAASVTDVMVRRTRLFYFDLDQGLGAVEDVGARMAGLLGWDDATRRAHEGDYRDEVARTRAWRDE